MNLDHQAPHILVVNNEPELLALKDEILEAEGFRVSMRLRDTTGLPDIAEINPDLLIMDYVSEAESALLDQLTADPQTEHIPIVLCSGAIREVDAIRPQLDAMGIRIIFMPFDIDDFIAVVREALGLAADPGGSLLPPPE